MRQCPGLYCGLLEPFNETQDSLEARCSACPRGYRVDEFSVCTKCVNFLSLYDWLYLGLMALLPLLLNNFFIEFSAKNRSSRRNLYIQHGMATLECSTAALVSLLATGEPSFSLHPHSCPVLLLSDWYPPLYNPLINYARRLRCANEAVYPRYSLPLLYYLLCTIFMTLLRIPACFLGLFRKEWRKTGVSSALYAALYFYPLLIIVHATGAGLLYFYFPYFVGSVSLVINALYLATIEDQTLKGILQRSFVNKIGLATFVAFSFVYFYCIVAAVGFDHILLLISLACLVPFPSLLYAFTVALSSPAKLLDIR